MTTTQHKVSALLPIPHYVLAGAPIYNFDFTSWTANLPTGWTLIGGATVARGYNEQTGKVDARLTAGAGALQHIQPITLGMPYRLTLVVRNMSLTPLTPTVLIVTNQGGPYPALMPGETRTITADYTAVVGSASIRVGTVEAGVLALGQATLTPIESEEYLDLNPTDLSLTLDESWTPYVQARLTCPMPPPDALALIDPRKRQRVNLMVTRSGAESMLVRDLTSMLHVSFDTTYNLAYTPRSNVWTKVAGGKTWATSALTGPGINPPNGVEGGSRFIQADTAASAAGEAFALTTPADLSATLPYLASVYVRTSVVTRVQVSVPGMAGALSPIIPVRASVWNRIVVPVNPTVPLAALTVRVTVLDAVPVGSVVDITQTQIEQIPDTSVTDASIYLDGGLGRVGDPPGFPIWTGAEFNSPSAKAYGATTVADFTRILGGSTIRTNRCTNPSFETGTTGWTAPLATITNPTSGGFSGARHLRATLSAPGTSLRGPAVNAAEGQQYTVSCYVRGTAGRAVRMYVTEWSGPNGTGTATTVGQGAAMLTLSGAWQRMSFTRTLGAGKQSVTYGPGGALMSAGDVLDVDAVLVEFAGAQGSYFDGSTAAAGTTTYAWSGTANASTSTAVTTQAQKYVWYLSDLFGDQFNPVLDVTLNQSRAFDLSLQERTLDHVAGTMSLLLTSDEMALQDLGRVNLADPATTPPSTSSLKTLVSWALNLIGTDLMAGASDAALVAADVQWSQGDTLWDFLDGFVGAAGLRLICDEQRRWYLRAQAPGAGGVAVINALVGVDDTLTRRGWSDSLILINQWTDPSVGTVTRSLAGTSSADGAGYTKTRIVPKTSKTPATIAGAQQVFPRVGTLGRLLGVTAVSDYTVTPGQSTTISTPTLAIGSAFIKSVTWELPGDEMTIETRDLAMK